MFSPDDLTVVDIRDWLRTNIERFLPNGYEPVALMMLIASECLRVTHDRVLIYPTGDWLVLEANVDWVKGWPDPFDRLTPMPPSGPNSGSILPASVALSAGVATWCDETGWEILVGADRPDVLPSPGTRRILAIR